MKKLISIITPFAGMFACMALCVAKVAGSRISFIYYQEEVPEKVKALIKD